MWNVKLKYLAIVAALLLTLTACSSTQPVTLPDLTPPPTPISSDLLVPCTPPRTDWLIINDEDSNELVTSKLKNNLIIVSYNAELFDKCVLQQKALVDAIKRRNK